MESRLDWAMSNHMGYLQQESSGDILAAEVTRLTAALKSSESMAQTGWRERAESAESDNTHLSSEAKRWKERACGAEARLEDAIAERDFAHEQSKGKMFEYHEPGGYWFVAADIYKNVVKERDDFERKGMELCQVFGVLLMDEKREPRASLLARLKVLTEALEDARDLMDDAGDSLLHNMTLERVDGTWDKVKAALAGEKI